MFGSLAFPLPLLWTLAHVFRVLLCIALNSILSCDTQLVSVPLKEERRFVLQDNLLFLPYFSYFCDPVAFHNFRWVPTFRSATKCGQWKMVSVSAWTVYFGLNMWILYNIYMYMYMYIYIHIYTHIYVYIHINTHICIYTYTYIYIYTHTHINTYIHIYTYHIIYIYTRIYTLYIISIHVQYVHNLYMYSMY